MNKTPKNPSHLSPSNNPAAIPKFPLFLLFPPPFRNPTVHDTMPANQHKHWVFKYRSHFCTQPLSSSKNPYPPLNPSAFPLKSKVLLPSASPHVKPL